MENNRSAEANESAFESCNTWNGFGRHCRTTEEYENTDDVQKIIIADRRSGQWRQRVDQLVLRASVRTSFDPPNDRSS